MTSDQWIQWNFCTRGCVFRENLSLKTTLSPLITLATIVLFMPNLDFGLKPFLEPGSHKHAKGVSSQILVLGESLFFGSLEL